MFTTPLSRSPRSIFAVFLLTLVLANTPNQTHATAVGLSQGKLSTDQSGGASYDMPIVVPPGTAGMQPKLSLHYSSGGRNGPVGVGWSIAGLSAITRTPQTRAQDNGVIHGVDMTLGDRYAMDGQRLIAITGTDGYAGTEYRTELNSFTKIISNSASGNGPATFTAWTKSGLIYTFGGANGASYVPPGRTDGTILTWLISKIQDQAGNYMTFSYTSEGNLSSVNYTMNDGAGLSTAYASIVFTYDATRPDPALGYVAGSGATMNQRLNGVTSFYGQQIVRKYALAYEVSANTQKSRLISITESSATDSYPPTVFTWDGDPSTLNYNASLVSGILDNNHSIAQGDFDGDGIVDLVKARANTSTLQVYKIQNGQLVTGGSLGGAGNFTFTSDTWLQGDFNGDGKLDVIRVHSGGDAVGAAVIFTQFLNTGTNGVGNAFTQSNATITGSTPLWYPSKIYIAADFNGDGKLDIICINGPDPQTGGAQNLRATVFINQGNGTFNGVDWTFPSAVGDPGLSNKDNCKSSDQWMVVDFNGDGLPDLVKVMLDNNKTSVRVYQNQNGSSFLAKTVLFQNGTFYKSDGVTPNYKWFSGDFNGDGLADLLRVPERNNSDNATAASVFLSTGSLTPGFAAGTPWLTLQVSDHDDLQVGDYNADGRADLVVLQDTASGQSGYYTTRSEYLSNGVNALYLQSSANYPLPSGAQPSSATNFTADFNGDGKEDLIRLFGTTGGAAYCNIYASTPGYQDLLRKVTDGMGVVTSIDYQPLTGINGINVFTKSTDAVAPAIDLIVPIPVLASITYDNGLGTVGGSGSTYTINYHYEGLKADPLRGMLGFEAVEAIDTRLVDNVPNKVIHTKTWFRQDFPYTGMAKRSSTFLAAVSDTSKTFGDHANLLSDVTTTYATGPTENAKVYFPYASDSHVYSWDLNGVATNDNETIVPTTSGVDVYGNTLNSTVQIKDLPSSNLFVKTTTSTYTTTTSNWRIGQVTNTSVVSQAPGQPNITRNSGFGYNPTTGEVSSETIEPGAANSLQTSYTFDSFGNTRVTTTTPPTGELDAVTGQQVPSRTTTTIDDNQGRFVVTTTNSLNQTETKGYDGRFGAATSVKGPNNLTDTAHYDDFGRKDLSTRADGTNTHFSYEWVSGNSNAPNAPTSSMYLVRVTPDDGAQSLVYFDRLGREMRKETIAGNAKTEFVDTTYDYRGRKSTVTKPYFKGDSSTIATTFYDAIDRMVQLQVPSVDETGAIVTTYTTTSYNGLTTTMTNPKGQSTATTKDAIGHVRQVVDALTGYINYTYDAVGNLVQTQDAAGNTSIITYDPLRGWKTQVSDPDLGAWTYSYYSTGELKTQKDAKSQIVKFSYDQLGRMHQRLEPTNDTTTWTYDNAPGKGIGKLASVQFSPAQGSQLSPYTNSMSYDNLARVSSQSTTIHGSTYPTSTSYDQFSRPLVLTYPTGFQVKEIYGANGYLTNIQSPDATKTYWTASDYNADGHITKEQYGNGIVTNRQYIPQNGLLKTITSGLGGGTGTQNLEYHFDVLANLKSRKDSNQTIGGNTLQETFNYDALNRLINWTVTGQPQQNVIYDTIGNGAGTASLGNIKHKDGVGDYTYPAAGSAHPHAALTAGASGTATYDPNGNMLSGFNRSITWTWFNQPQLITGYSSSAYFEYDPDHQRVWQHTPSADTTYVGGFYEKVDDANTTKHKCYINAPTGRIVIYTQTYDKHTLGTTYDTKYLHKDHLGSVDVITDASGAVLERDSFNAWGFRRTTDWQSQKPIGSTSIVSRGFTDHEELDTLGLVNMNGRIYDPGLGRFLSADPFVQAPMVTQNLNRYSYVVNNPLSLSDPSGFNIFGDFFNWLNKNLGSIGTKIVIGVIAAVVSIVAWYAAPIVFTSLTGIGTTVTLAGGATALSSTGAIVAAVGAGFAGGFTSTILSGGSLGQAFEAGLIGGAIAGATAALLEFGLPALSHALNGEQTTTYYETGEDASGHPWTNPVQPEDYENQAVVLNAHGIHAFTPEDAAIRAGNQGFFDIGPGLPHLIAFHQSNGYFADIIETGADMFSHQGTPLSQQLADGLSHFDLANSFVLAHSGGAAVLNRALELAARNGISVAGLNVGLEGGAVNYALAQAEYRRLGVTLDFANGHAFDLVPQVVGGNAITSFHPWRIFTSILGIPFLQTVHAYPEGQTYPPLP